jgi:hypothetical protein
MKEKEKEKLEKLRHFLFDKIRVIQNYTLKS